MGFSLQIPSVGQPHSTEDVKVGNDLSTLQTWGNGQILGSDLSPTAAIARSQMAGGFGNLAYTPVSTNTSASDGAFYNVTVNTGVTITLPTPTINRTVGVRAGLGSATTPVTVTVSSGLIGGVGIVASSLVLGTQGAFVVLQADGTNWSIVAGQQDTGWVTFSLPASWTSGSFGDYAPAARRVGDFAFLRGSAQNNTGGSATFTATLAAPFRPAATEVQMSASISPVGAFAVSVASSGTLTASPLANNGTIFFDGLSYSLVS